MKRVFFISITLVIVMLNSSAIWQPSTSAQDPDTLGTRLRDLEFDTFLDASFKEILLRDPEVVMQLGLAETLRLEAISLTNVSDEYVQETYALYALILDILHDYDRDALTPEQQLSYDIYEWYLDDVLHGQEFQYYNYPVTYHLSGIQNQTAYFFTEVHPINSRENAENYITRLTLVDDKFNQLIDRLKAHTAAGIIPPSFVIRQTLNSMHDMISSPAGSHPYFTAFRRKLEGIALDSPEKQELLEAARGAVEGSVIPAYRDLAEYLGTLMADALDQPGVWQFPRGDDYYAYQLRHHTQTDLTAEEIHALGLRELERIHDEMRTVFADMGYSPDISIAGLYERVGRDSGYVPGEQAIETYNEIISAATERLGEAFDLFPETQVIVQSDPNGGGYYIPAALDGSRPAIFYAWTGSSIPRFDMYSLAYHETVPGHHLQIAIAQETPMPMFRQNLPYTAFAEGWALYAEYLAAELNWYENNPHGYLGYLRYQAFRAARLVVDTGIHAMGWTFEEAVNFWVENVGHDSSFAQGQIMRYTVDPGQATAYMIGMLKILELRQDVQDALGDQYDLKEFHTAILSNGSLPLPVLEMVVEHYIEEKIQ